MQATWDELSLSDAPDDFCKGQPWGALLECALRRCTPGQLFADDWTLRVGFLGQRVLNHSYFVAVLKVSSSDDSQVFLGPRVTK